MNKRTALRFLPFILLGFVLLPACGKSGSAEGIDAKQLSDNLIKNIKFEDELSLVDNSKLTRIYDVEDKDYTEAVCYQSSYSSEEIAIFTASDDETASKIEKAFNKRLEEQKEKFKDYNPDQVPRLEKAIIEKIGKYVILIVCDDSESARTFINNSKKTL